MKTKILRPSKRNLIKAANALIAGEIIGIPTETVYGLGANAFDTLAIEKIFVCKNRPQDNPLIVHLHKKYPLLDLVENVSDRAKMLLENFTPGPLTLVFKSRGKVSPLVSRGLDTLAIRYPSSKIAQRLLEMCNIPIAAPSANISSRLSTTAARDVKAELEGKIPLIIDGGKCTVGIESTVVDVSGDVPVILRPGIITREMIEKVVGPIEEKVTVGEGRVVSPGVKYNHYLPSVRVFVCGYGDFERAKTVYRILAEKGKNPVIVCMHGETHNFLSLHVKDFGKNPKEVASNLYGVLRSLEKKFGSIVICGLDPTDPEAKSVMNRISKMHRDID